jgi:hypothetical protein
MVSDENEPYTRWQGFRINQLSVCISVFLTFAVATLGFSINLLTQANYPITECSGKVCCLLSLLGGLLSLLLGLLAHLTRLHDFRKTAKVVRHRSDQNMKAEVERWRGEYKRLGDWTWRLFKGQLISFGIQITGLAIAFTITYMGRLT